MTQDYELIPTSDNEQRRSNTNTHASTWTFVAASLVVFCSLVGFLNPTNILLQRFTVLGASSFTLAISILSMSVKSEVPIEPYNPTRQTWFGHLMSHEGEWTNIPVVLCASYSFVFFYGAVVSLLTGSHILCIPAFYVVGMVVFYAWHVAAHCCESTELHRQHMHHHRARYPQEDFFGDSSAEVQSERAARGKPHTIRSLMLSPTESTYLTFAHEGSLAIAMIGIVVIAKFVVGVSTGACLFGLGGYAFMASFGSAIHMSFHERDFQLEPYAWYRELRSLHMIHHMERKNYAMVNVLVDMVFGSLMVMGD